MLWWILFSIGWYLFVSWVVRAYSIIWFFRKHRLTKSASSLQHLSNWPLASIVVPARDEERGIEDCLRSLMTMDYPSLEIIAVDDRSRDQTGAIMERLAKEDEHLKVIHIKDLPEKWLGKNHAMYKASQEAKGDFILFTDGDVIFKKETIRLAIQYATHKKLDHLCLLPQMIPGSYWENALTTFFELMLICGIKPWTLSSNSKKSYAGVGAFNLVRKTAYEEVGGHEAIRLEVIDDFKLGKILKHSGFRLDMLIADDLIKVKWQTGVRGFIKGLEKNGYAMGEYSITFLSFLTLFLIWAIIIPYIGLFTLHDSRMYGYLLAVLVMHGIYGYTGSRCQSGWKISLALPFAMIVHLWAFWRSAFITLKQGGIMWRDTFYPLEILRNNVSR